MANKLPCNFRPHLIDCVCWRPQVEPTTCGRKLQPTGRCRFQHCGGFQPSRLSSLCPTIANTSRARGLVSENKWHNRHLTPVRLSGDGDNKATPNANITWRSRQESLERFSLDHLAAATWGEGSSSNGAMDGGQARSTSSASVQVAP